MSRFLGIAVVQRQTFEASAEKNLAEIESTIDLLAMEYPWVRLVVFPELAVTGFGLDPFAFGESVPGPATDRLAKKAKETGKWIIPGSMIEVADGRIYNTMPVLSPDDGLVAAYRKMNPFSPLEPCVPGSENVVVDMPGIGKLGLLICYDLYFPEMARTLVSMGAEVIIHPSLTPATLNYTEVLTRRAMAMLNQAYVVGASSCGVHFGIATPGHSMIVDPEGIVLQEAGDAPSIQIEMLDLDRVTMVREVGLKGSVPIFKHLNHFAHTWPVYGNQKASSPYLSRFGSPNELPADLNNL